MSTPGERLAAVASLAPCADVLFEIYKERGRQDAKFGDQTGHPDGTGSTHSRSTANIARSQCESATEAKRVTWHDILREEYCEAMAETDYTKLRAELVQVATVCVAWIEALDKRNPKRDATA